MREDVIASSDTHRTAAPLTHARYARLDGPLELELGGTLKDVQVCYETYGALNARRDNAVLICHALSGDSHVARHNPHDAPGWWDIVVGPGKAVDTDRFHVICPNVLGGCRGTTGPGSLNPKTGRPYGRDFPAITILDIVEVQMRLIDRLGIQSLRAVIGGSMGGQMVLAWAIRHPDRVDRAVAIATAPRLTSQALAFDIVGRNAITSDPGFRGGRCYGEPSGPDTGLAIARMIGHITYLSRESMREKFDEDRHNPRDVRTIFEKTFSVGSYLGYQGERFVDRFDANSYLALTRAMDLFDLGGAPHELRRTLSRSRCHWLLVSFSSDWLFPPDQTQSIVNALIAGGRVVSSCSVASSCGHDAFLLPNDLPTYGELIRGFLIAGDIGLKAMAGRRTASDHAAQAEPKAPDPLSIFHSQRLDYDRIVELIPPGSSVLDLGCGAGGLLLRLGRRGCGRLVGVEIDEKAIVACVQLGLPVIHADLNRGLDQFPDGSFDYVVLSQTLQAVVDVEGLLAGIVRIGRRAIVSFPNFAFQRLRTMLAEEGRAPESPGLLRHRWFNTPDLRFFSIRDFEELCREKGFRIHRRITLDTEAGVEIVQEPNRLADLAIYVVSNA